MEKRKIQKLSHRPWRSNLHTPLHQTDLLQYIFQFCDTKECLEQFLLVCKSWKLALDKITFYFAEIKILLEDFNLQDIHMRHLSKFKAIEIIWTSEQAIPFGTLSVEQKTQMYDLLLKNLKNLMELTVEIDVTDETDITFLNFIQTLIQNSQNTLMCISVNNIVFLNKLTFPELDILNLDWDGKHIDHFDALLHNISQMEFFTELNFLHVNSRRLCPENLQKLISRHQLTRHCVDTINALNVRYFPAKICYGAYNLNDLRSAKYVSSIEYLNLGFHFDLMEESGFLHFEEIIKTCLINIKAISISGIKFKCRQMISIFENNIQEFIDEYVEGKKELENIDVVKAPLEEFWQNQIFKTLREKNIKLIAFEELREIRKNYLKGELKILM